MRAKRASVSAPQLVAIGVIVIGLLTKHVVGYIVAGVAFCLILVEIVLAIRRADRGFDRVRKRIANATHWPKDTPTREGAFDPYESDRVTGTMSRRIVRAALHVNGAIACVDIPHWPTSLSLRRRGDGAASGTGDDDFDRAVEMRDPLDLWRTVLTSRVREQLHGLFGSWHASIEGGTITVELGDSETDELELVLDLCVNLDVPSDSSTDREATVFALAKTEPVGGVRLGHYRWLVERNWNAPLVFRTAAADADAAISTWARQHLPPEVGAFR